MVKFEYTNRFESCRPFQRRALSGYLGMMLHRIETTDDPRASGFLAYCAAHGKEHDESYMPEADWEFGPDFPSFALISDDGSVRGVAAGMLGPSFRAARRARVAILHVMVESHTDYRTLLDALGASIAGRADELYLFIPETLTWLRTSLEASGFSLERTVYLMRADAGDPRQPASQKEARVEFPQGYGLAAVTAGDAAAQDDFIAIRNRNFKELRGSSDQRAEDLAAFIASRAFLEGGLVRLLSPDGTACGTLRVERDEDDGSAFIGTISVDKEHRGRGLARGLIRAALSIAGGAGMHEAFLSVNADNRTALKLYLEEGFSIVKAMSCLSVNIPLPHARGAWR